MRQKVLSKLGNIKDSIANVFTDEKAIQEKAVFIHKKISDIQQNNSNIIKSKYYQKSENDLTFKTNGVLFVALVSFHQKKGSTVEYTYPPEKEILINQKDFFNSLQKVNEEEPNENLTGEIILQDILNQLSYFCLPDGIHVLDEDTQMYIIQNYSTVLFCTFSYRQIRTNVGQVNIVDDFQENTRDCVQKSLCIVSTYPLFLFYYEKINGAMNLFINQQVLNEKTPLNNLYHELTENYPKLTINDFRYERFFSYRKLIEFLHVDLITIIKYILLEKKIIVFSHNPQNPVMFILSLLSLIPGILMFNYEAPCDKVPGVNTYQKSLQQLGLPLYLFNNNNMIYPLFTLFDLDFISKTKINGILLGTSNALVINTKEIKADCLINLDEKKIIYKEDTIEEKAIKFTDKEKELYSKISQALKIKESEDKRELKGDWIIYDKSIETNSFLEENLAIYNEIKMFFYDFIYELSLVCLLMKQEELEFTQVSDSSDKKDEDDDWTVISRAEMIGTNLPTLTSQLSCESLEVISSNLSQFNIYFISLWVQTNNFKFWYKNQEPLTGYRSCHARYIAEIPIIYQNGDTYSGGLYHGQKFGKGTYYYAKSGLTYIGYFEKDKRKGKGNLSSKDNKYLYEGGWNNDKMNGSGSLITPNEKYTGNFLEGLYWGEGCLVEKNGNVYQGSFKEGKKNGFGKQKYINGDTFEGYFVDNIIEGMGKRKKANGEKEEGHFQDGVLNGDGIKTSNDGKIFVGKFKNGVPHGEGKILNLRGELLEEGIWIEGIKNI